MQLTAEQLTDELMCELTVKFSLFVLHITIRVTLQSTGHQSQPEPLKLAAGPR